ncbi:hypothetical protein MED222_05605 [Vibrio sp. MED222]|nr:hypothetical protein MED222_05605 [Vibrio sp. MED222]
MIVKLELHGLDIQSLCRYETIIALVAFDF